MSSISIYVLYLTYFLQFVKYIICSVANISGTNSGGHDFVESDLSAKQRKTHDEIMRRANFRREHLIDARLTSEKSILQDPHRVKPSTHNHTTGTSNYDPVNVRCKGYPAMIKLITGSLVGEEEYNKIYADLDSNGNESGTSSDFEIPTLTGIARKVAMVENKMLDEKQYITYEIICCTFLLGLVTDGSDHNTILGRRLGQTLGSSSITNTEDIVEDLVARGGMTQLLMFLTGPAGAGKSTAIKVAQRFCFEFCRAVGNLWSDSTFLFTAYTGVAAALFGGVTIVKHAYLMKGGDLSEDDIKEWKDVRILIIDEISFMKDSELLRLDTRLKEMGDRNKPFGGFSIIFAGDFRQLEPSKSSDKDLLFSSTSSGHWENCINATIILDNSHRFKDDPEYGKLLKRMWIGGLTKKDRDILNTRVIGHNGLTLPAKFEGDACYACPTNKERNAISATSFENHVNQTHPNVHSTNDPPHHTIIVEAAINSSLSKRSKQKIDNVIRHRIITTCGDHYVRVGQSKKIDPALCLYVGAYLICVIENKYLTERVPRGNGTLCRVISLKLKDHPTTHRWKNYYGKKVWTVCASDVEWLEVELAPKPKRIVDQEENIEQMKKDITCAQNAIKYETSRKQNQRAKTKIKTMTRKLTSMTEKLDLDHDTQRFRMEPENFSPQVVVKPYRMATTDMTFTCRMTQLPVNLNDATTGHKLQGTTKDVIIITSWPRGSLFKNWEYVVLSRVRTLNGVYLLEPIDMHKHFEPSSELKRYLLSAKRKEKSLLQKIKRMKAKLAAKRAREGEHSQA